MYLTNKTNLIEVGNNKFRRRDDDDNDPAIKTALDKIANLFSLKNSKEHNFFEFKVKKKNDSKAINIKKLNKENEIILHIEKTFGPVVTYSLFYIFFCIFVLYFIIYKYNMNLPNYLNQVIIVDYIQQQFQVNFTMFDFYEQNSFNSYNRDNYSYYSSYINLTEIQMIDLVFKWITNIYLANIGFIEGYLTFMERNNV